MQHLSLTSQEKEAEKDIAMPLKLLMKLHSFEAGSLTSWLTPSLTPSRQLGLGSVNVFILTIWFNSCFIHIG